MTATSSKTTVLSLILRSLRGEEMNFTEGSINRALVLLAVPMIVEMGMESIFAVVDIFFVSRLNESAAVAAVGYTESVLSILYSLAMGLGMGATAFVARRIGEKNPEGAGHAAMQSFYIALLIAASISALGILYHRDILRLLGASEFVIESGARYALWMFAGNYTITFLFVINAVFRGAGQAHIAMQSLVLANVLNIILDPIFIFGWGPVPAMGVEGAAIATNTGRAVGVLFQLYYLFTGKSVLQFTKSALAPRLRLMARVLKISVGSILQFLIGSASWIFLMSLMARFGDDAAAGYTIAIRIFIFTLLPSWGLANAAATLVGQNLGAQQPLRAEQSAWRAAHYNSIVMAVVMIVFLLLATPIVGIFTGQPAVLSAGVEALRYVSLGYIFYGYGMVMVQALNGAGDTYTPTALNVIGFWLFQIPFAYWAATQLEWGPKSVYIAIVLAETLMAVSAVVIFRGGRWKKVKI